MQNCSCKIWSLLIEIDDCSHCGGIHVPTYTLRLSTTRSLFRSHSPPDLSGFSLLSPPQSKWPPLFAWTLGRPHELADSPFHTPLYLTLILSLFCTQSNLSKMCCFLVCRGNDPNHAWGPQGQVQGGFRPAT